MAQSTRFCDISMKVACVATHLVPTSPLFIMTIVLLAWQFRTTAPKARWSWSSWTSTLCQRQAELLTTHFVQVTLQSWQRSTSHQSRSEHQLNPGSVLATEDSLQESSTFKITFSSKPVCKIKLWMKLDKTLPGRSLEAWARGRRRLRTEPEA